MDRTHRTTAIGRPARLGDRRVAWTCRASILLAIAGVFGTWRTYGAVSLNGVDGPHNGWLVVIFALIAVAGVGPLSRGSWPGIIAVLGSAAVMLYAAVLAVVEQGDVVGGRSGWGVWLTIVTSAVLAGAAVLAAVRRARPR